MQEILFSAGPKLVEGGGGGREGIAYEGKEWGESFPAYLKKPGGGEERETPTSNGDLVAVCGGRLGCPCDKSKDMDYWPVGSESPSKQTEPCRPEE